MNWTANFPLSEARIIGDYDTFSTDGGQVIRLGKNSAAIFPLDFPRSGYYRFQIRCGDLTENSPPRLECLIDDRVIGTTYFSHDHPPSGSTSSFGESVSLEDLGTHFVDKGQYRFELRALFEPTECVDYVKITLTDRVVEEPLFTFVTLTDTHILGRVPHPPRGGKISMGKGCISLYDNDVPSFPHLKNWINHLLFENMPGIMGRVTERINQLNPDFVIHTGDVAGERREYLEASKYFLNKLNCPYYIARGNHDDGDEMLNVFSKITGDKTYYSFNHKGFHFVILDSSYYFFKDKVLQWPGEGFDEKSLKGLVIPEEELKWLEGDLKRYGKMKTFVFAHCPLAVSRRCPHPDYPERLYNYKEACQILDQYKNLKAVFAGHMHINDLVKRKNVYHFQTSSLIEYPMSYRQIVIFPSHIEVRTYQMNREFLRESFLATPENVFNEAPNGWVIGRNAALHSEL